MERLEDGQAPEWLGKEEAGCAEKTLIYFRASLKPVERAEQALPTRLTKMSQNEGTCISPLVSKVDAACPGKGVV